MQYRNIHTSIRWMAAAFMATAILSACSHKEDEPAAGEPLLIAANSVDSRAATPLKDKYKDFGVWAWKTKSGSTSLVLGRNSTAFPGTEYYTRYEGTAWTYVYSDASAEQYLRYWDRAASYYTFSAYAPYKQGEVVLNTAYTIRANTSGINIEAVKANMLTTAGIDWLEARWKRDFDTLKDKDLVKDVTTDITNFNYIVPLAFYHILSEIEFRVYSTDNLKLSSLTIALNDAEAIYTQADYAYGAWNYASASKATDIYSLSTVVDLTGYNEKSKSRSIATLLQLPQSVKDRTIKVNATTTDMTARIGSFQLLSDWERGKKYIYYLCIKGDEIALMSFSVEPWAAGKPIDIKDPLDSW